VRIARSLGVVRLEGGRASGRREAVEICGRRRRIRR